jgi:hypothetical protein
MRPSVRIKTPIPSLGEIASDLGITEKRLDGVLELVGRRTKSSGHNGSVSMRPSRVKNSEKKTSAKRADRRGKDNL